MELLEDRLLLNCEAPTVAVAEIINQFDAQTRACLSGWGAVTEHIPFDPPGVNPLVNNPNADFTEQDTQSETTIIAFGSTVLVGFNDSGSFVGGAEKFTGFSRSTNGGNSFVDQGTLPTNPAGDVGDPVLARDEVSGTIYFATLMFNGTGMQVFRSFDDGATFTAPVNGAPGFAAGAFLDKEWIAVDNFAGAGQGNVYMALRSFGGTNDIRFTRSTDGGATWGPNGGTQIIPGGQGAFVTVGPDHSVYVFWYDQGVDSIRMRKSTDLGVTFGPPVTVANTLTTGVNGDLGLGFRTNAFPHAAVNPVTGDIFVVFNDNPPGADRANVFITQSTNGGFSWTPRKRVNDDLTNNDQWQPTLAITPNGANIGVFWYDRRLDATNFLIDYFGVVGDISGSTVTFQSNFPITDVAFPPVFGVDPVVNPTYMGDYDQAAADNNSFYTVWGDNRDMSLAAARNQQNVRFATIAVVDTIGPRVIDTTPVDGSIVNGPVSFIDFTFSETMDPTSFGFVDNPFTPENENDVVSFTGPGAVDLIPDITRFSWINGDTTLRLNFNAQGPSGDYSITIGPNITDVATVPNPMDQDQDGTNGEIPDDEFSMTFSISTPRVVSVRLQTGTCPPPPPAIPGTVVVSFNKDLDQSTLPGNVFVERSGGDQIFGNGNDVVVANSGNYDATTFSLTFSLGTCAPDDLYRIRLEDNITDDPIMGNRLDGEFDGPPPAGNNNMFPSGNNVVGGDFLYPFFFGSAAVPVAALPALERTDNPIDVSGLDTQRNESQPTIVVDPADPQKLVATYQIVEQNPNLCNVGVRGDEAITRCVAFSFSNDGGATWSFGSVMPIPRNPTTVTTAPDPGRSFLGAVSPWVAFDRNHNFYIVYSVVTPVINPDDNAILMRKFDFSGTTPVVDFIADHTRCPTALYCGAGSAADDVARNPVITVDTNPGAFADPATGVVFRDPYTELGTPVYVAWDIFRPTPPNVGGGFNNNGIQFTASADGGVGFSAPFNVNDFAFGSFDFTAGFFGSDRNIFPKLAVSAALPEISQGVADPESARVHLVWEEFGTSTQFDSVIYDRTTNDLDPLDPTNNGTRGLGTQERTFSFTPIFDQFTSIDQIFVSENFSIRDVNLEIRLDHANLEQLNIDLISPTGTVVNITSPGFARGANFGSNVFSFDAIGAKIDDEAPIALPQGNGPYTNGVYQPFDFLTAFDGEDSAGSWSLLITDTVGTGTGVQGLLFAWALQVSGDIGQDSFDFDNALDSSRLKANAPLQLPAHPLGVSMSPTIATDTTLGSYSPNQGAVYVAYTIRLNPTDRPNDTDIVVSRIDPDFGFPANFTIVNDDHTNEVTTGVRSQFHPSLAVDPATGTVVASWLDARNDAANARVATYISASADGGATFSANEFVNRPQLENDNLDPLNPCIACINMGPIPDNQSAGNPSRDTIFAFGTHQGLAVAGGQVYAAWSSNENQRDNTSGDRRLDIRVSQAAVTAGPRVIDNDPSQALNSTMGPTTPPLASYTVNFDRPIDPATFTLGAGSTTPIFRATFDNPLNPTDGFTIDNDGSDGNPGTTDDGQWHRSSGRGSDAGHSSSFSMYYGSGEGPAGGGIYSDNTSGTITSPPIDLTSATGSLFLNFNHFLEAEDFFDDASVNILVGGVPTEIADNDSSDLDNLPDSTNGFESVTLDISAFAGQVIQVQFSFDTDFSIVFEGWYIDDVTIAGPTPDATIEARDEFGVLLATQPVIQSVTPRNCNQFGCSTFTVNFTAQSETGTYSYSVGPDISDRIRTVDDLGVVTSPGNRMDQDGDGADGETPDDIYFTPRTPTDTATLPIIIPGPHIVSSTVGVEYPSFDVPTPLAIPDGGSVTSIIKLTDRYPIADLDVLLNITHTNDSDLTVRLSHTDRLNCVTTVTLFSGVGGSGDNFIRTVLDDTGASGPIAVGAAPFTGSYIPQNSLSAFQAAPDPSVAPACTPTVPIGGNLEGTWTLTITDAAGNGGGTLDGWSLIATPNPATDPLDENLVLNGTVSFFDVVFDQPMDPNTFMIEDVQRIIGPAGLIAPRPQDTFTALDRRNIPDAVGATPGVLTSTLTISRSAIIRDLNARLDITHPNASDLTVQLTSPDPDGPGPLSPITVTLFSGVGGAGDNFIGTVLDDEQPVAIDAGAPLAVAPFAGRFRPVGSLSAFDGIDVQGTWTLTVTDSTTGQTGRLESWSLSLDVVTVTPNPRGTDADPNFPQTFRISFPTQTLSGTYQLVLGPNIASQRGELMDQNLDAGVQALRNVEPTQKTFTPTIADPTITNDSVPLLSSIRIEDNFLVRDVDLQLDITHLNVSDIRAFLVFTEPNGTQTRVELFTGVGGTGNHFSDTIMDDEATFVNGSPRIIGAPGTAAPFLGRHRPEQFNSGLPGTRLSDFDGKNARGTWTLEVTDSVANAFPAGTLNSWSLTFQTPPPAPAAGLEFDQTGLGNFAADSFGGSFRIFVMDQTDVRATSVWTPVGPAAIGVNGNSGRTGAIAVDFSDPSGNTVFIAGATGGVWKTNNFLTTDADGPIWIPLTDFGPTSSLSMGSIALFPRNQDPNQTIVYAATGEGDAGFGGTGFLKSMNGGATWQILDSTDNTVPFAQRTHDFAGSLAFKIIVDYTNPDVVYAALSDSTAGGGVWRSFDGGLTWLNARPGIATDLAIDPVNPEVIYAAFRGQGVFRTPDKGFRWDLLTGGVGNPQFVDGDVTNFPTIPVSAPPDTPNGLKGRISLAKPPTTDPTFQGWIYALVAEVDGRMNGVYQSKDFGQNWVRLNLPGLAPNPQITLFRPLPTNEEDQQNVNPLCRGDGSRCQGNYDQSIAVDAVDPNIVYVGGQSGPALIRIDTTRTYDAHAVVAFDNDNEDGGLLQHDTDGSAIRKNKQSTGANVPPAPDIANPAPTTTLACEFAGVPIVRGYNVFAGCQSNVSRIVNTGHETQWQVVTLGEHVDHHDIFTFVDPITGKSRLIVGTDGGFWTGVDDEVQDASGALNTVSGIGTAFSGSGSRNGNLQITQFYYGAVQPSQLSADVSGTLFFGASQDNGLAISGPNVLIDGQNGTYGSVGGDVGGVATDPTGSGIFYSYFWPCCSFSPLQQEFFGVADEVTFQLEPRVNGLFQFGGIGTEWPLLGPAYGANFAVNPRDGQQLAMSSATGRVYKLDRASDPFAAWFQIGDPAIFGNSQAFALAYGASAPDPDPNDSQEPDDILYVGTSVGPNPGRVLVTFTEGGNAGIDWFDISCSERSIAAAQTVCDMDGTGFSSVRQIVANLKEGSKEAFAVTFDGVYHLPNSEDAVNGRDINGNGTLEPNELGVRQVGDNRNFPWQDITGNLFQIINTLYPGWNADDPAFDDTIPKLLRTIQVDDRYQIPDSPGVDCAVDVAACHPLIYVGGDAGVYRSFDLGQTWDQYPSVTVDNATLQGGYLPNAIVSDLDLAIGPFDPATGLTDFTQSLDILSAATFGRGTFAIRTSPLIFSGGGSSFLNAPDLLAADDTGVSNTDNITANDGGALPPPIERPLRFTGLTMRGASVDLFEEDAAGVLRIVGTDLADPVDGTWEVAVDPANPLECGPHTLRAQATTFVGTKGPLSQPLVISVLSERPIVSVGPDLLTADDTFGVGTSGTNTDDLTRVTTPRFTGTTVCGTSLQPVGAATMRLMIDNSLGIPNVKGPVVVDPDTGTSYATLGIGTSLADGTWTAQIASGTPLVPDGVYPIVVRAEDLAGNIGVVSGPIIVTIDTVVSPAPTITTIVDDTCAAPPASCNFGSTNDRITRDQTLVISGIVEANSLVTLRQSSGPAIPGGPVFPSVLADGAGNWTVDLTSITLADGTYSFTVTAVDRAGNTSPTSAASTVTVDTTISTPTSLDLIDTDDTCAPQTSVAPAACSGGSHTDNITRVTTPTLRGLAEVGSRVDIFTNVAGFTFLGSAIAGNDASDAALGGTASDGLGLWTFTVGGLGAATGPFNSGLNISVLYNVTAVATDLAGNVSGASNVLALTIDTEPPAKPSSPPDLESTSDTFPAPPPTIGTDTDNITRDNTPTFNGANGSAEADGLVTLTSTNLSTGATQTLGTAPANSLGGWTFTVATGSGALTGPLADGRYSITFDNTDIAGNVSLPSDPLSPVVIDTVVAAPSSPDLTDASDTCDPPSSVAPAPCDRGTHVDNITSTNTPSFTGTAEALGRVELFAGALSLGIAAVVGDDASDGNPTDGKGAWTFTTNWSSILPIDGTYTITGRTTDQAGNISSASVPGLIVTIDRTKPTASTIPDLVPASDTGISTTDNITRGNGPAFNGAITLSGNADLNTTVRIFDNATCTGPALGQVTPASNRVWNFTTAPLSQGTHSITASATDSAGNESDCSLVLSVLIDTTIAQPSTPVLDPASDSGTSPNGSNSDRITFDNTPTLTGTVEANGTGIPQANTSVTVFDGGNPISSPFAANTSGAWSFTPITGLADGTHVITVQATDAAGNVSIFSAALNVTIDTVIAIPVISRITPDNGPSANDHVTNNGSLMFQGTAEPCTAVLVPSPLGCTQVTLTQVGVAGDFGIAFTDSLGNWTFDNSARVLAPGNYSFTATARDAAGNVSAATAPFNVTIDTAPPAINAAPSLELGDDTGLAGDLITKLRQPRLTGNVFDNLANVQVQIFRESDVLANNFSDPLGTATASANGAYVVQADAIHALADGSHTVRIRATDAAGNVAISPSLTFTVDATPPNVQSFCTPTSTQTCPASPVTATTGQLVVTFNGGDLNVCPSPSGSSTVCGTNPSIAFAGSVLNPANYSLVGTSRGTFNLSTSQFVLSPGPMVGTSVLTINLRDSSGNPTSLPNDTWGITINGTTSVQDIAGNKLDGEFPGTGTATCQPQSRPSGFPSGNCIEGGNFARTFTIAVPPPSVISVTTAGTRKVITQVFITFNGALNRTIAETDTNYELRDVGKDRQFDTRDDKVIRLAQADCNPAPADCTRVTVKAIKGFSRKRSIRLTVRDTLLDVGGNRLDGNGDGQPGGNFTTIIGPTVAARTAQVAAQVVDRMLESGATPTDLIVDELLSAGPRRGRWIA